MASTLERLNSLFAEEGDAPVDGRPRSAYSCVVCSAMTGDVEGAFVKTVYSVKLLRPPFEDATPVCSLCLSRMPVDPTAMREAFKVAAPGGGVSDLALREFVRQFVSRAWSEEGVPSWQTIAEALNVCALWSPNGRPWTYANLSQKAARMRLVREDFLASPELVADRAIDEASAAMPVAEAWLASRRRAAKQDSEWKGAVPAPEGMPGERGKDD